MVSRNAKRELVCDVLSSNLDRKSKTNIISKKNKYYLKHNQLSEDIPIVVIFKALGIESDYSIMSAIGEDDVYISAIGPSLIECKAMNIFNQDDAQEFMSTKIKIRRTAGQNARAINPKERMQSAIDFLCNSLLNHVPANTGVMKEKAVYLGLMLRRLIAADNGLVEPDDRDFYGNKRIELAGSLLSLLFEDLFKRFNQELRRVADNNLTKTMASPLDIVRHMRQDQITNGFVTALSSGNWVIKRFAMERHGVTQALQRLSYISMLGMMTRINSTFEKTRKVNGPRSIQCSQYGTICVSDTPEGESCGLVKNLALLTHVTVDSNEEEIIRVLYNCGVQTVVTLKMSLIHNPNYYIVFLNGCLIGLIKDTNLIVNTIRKLRRCGLIDPLVSVSLQDSTRSVIIASDGGRLCRPYIIVNESGVCLLEERHISEMKDNQRDFDSLIREGVVEFLDVNELNNSNVAIYERDIVPGVTTHMEVSDS